MEDTPQEVIRLSESDVANDAEMDSSYAFERFRMRAVDPERSPHAQSEESPVNVDPDRVVASARIQVKVDRSLGRTTDPKIVEMSGL